MFWMAPCSFLLARGEMIWMSPARVMFLKHEGHPPELIIVIQLTASVLCSLCREAAGCADVRHDKSGWGWQTAAVHPCLCWLTIRRWFFFLSEYIDSYTWPVSLFILTVMFTRICASCVIHSFVSFGIRQTVTRLVILTTLIWTLNVFIINSLHCCVEVVK